MKPRVRAYSDNYHSWLICEDECEGKDKQEKLQVQFVDDFREAFKKAMYERFKELEKRFNNETKN